jgi:glycosyltransferase involved in cell wall biosynthesis
MVCTRPPPLGERIGTMRVALVVPGGVDRTGEYRVIPALLALLRRLGRVHDVQVFALRQETEPAEWQLGAVRVHNIGSRFNRMRAVGAILAEHRARRFDLVHSIWSGSCGLIAVTAGSLMRRPSIVHVAGGELVALPEIGYGGGLTVRGRIRERLTLRRASAVTAPSAPIVAAVAQLGVFARRVPLGVDLEVWPPRGPVPREQSQAARLIHVASLNRVKDQTTLLRALAVLADSRIDFEMDMVGEDTLDGEIQALAGALGLSAKVRFHGFHTQRSLRALVEAAHLMIISSRHEAGPLVALEAAVAGVPTVGTAVGHIAEWAPQAAVAVPVGDFNTLAHSIARMLADEQLRLRIAREAQTRALDEDADHTAEAFEGIYTGLAGVAGG